MKKEYSQQEINKFINLAHKNITRRKGKDYSPSVHEIQKWIDDYISEKDEDSELSEKNTLKGGLSDGKTLMDLAKKHAYDDSTDSTSKEKIMGMFKELKLQLRKGLKVEMEHVKDEDVAREIVMDHLYEDPKYYDKLNKIELSESKTILTEKHESKDFDKFVKYAEKYLNSRVEVRNHVYRFCPKGFKGCYIAHREDNAIFELFRFYAKVYNTSKKEIEDSFKQNIKIVKHDIKETSSDSSGSYEGSLFGSQVKRPITKIHNMNEQEEIDEVTDSSSSGSYDVPFGGGGKNPLKIDGPESIKKSRAVKDKNFPKWGGPKGVYVKVKEKCKKFPYCNQGNTGAIEFYEVDGLVESIKQVSKEKGIPYSELEKIVLNEINKIFIK